MSLRSLRGAPRVPKTMLTLSSRRPLQGHLNEKYIAFKVVFVTSRTVKVFALPSSSRTDLHDDVVDVTSFSALDLVEINKVEVFAVVDVFVVGAGHS